MAFLHLSQLKVIAQLLDYAKVDRDVASKAIDNILKDGFIKSNWSLIEIDLLLVLLDVSVYDLFEILPLLSLLELSKEFRIFFEIFGKSVKS